MQRDTEDKIVDALQQIATSHPDYSSIKEALGEIKAAIENEGTAATAATAINVEHLDQTVINNVLIHLNDWEGTLTVSLHQTLPPKLRPRPLVYMTRGKRS